mmetsp:Transcript_37967/g.56455  ORF Transcript_37967/g.56455 Transcript_37967/m.56455 type:complete len:109 (+) Transcript_37967:231-557(+)
MLQSIRDLDTLTTENNALFLVDLFLVSLLGLLGVIYYDELQSTNTNITCSCIPWYCSLRYVLDTSYTHDFFVRPSSSTFLKFLCVINPFIGLAYVDHHWLVRPKWASA